MAKKKKLSMHPAAISSRKHRARVIAGTAGKPPKLKMDAKNVAQREWRLAQKRGLSKRTGKPFLTSEQRSAAIKAGVRKQKPAGEITTESVPARGCNHCPNCGFRLDIVNEAMAVTGVMKGI